MRCRRPVRTAQHRGDAGSTLIEVMVTMTVMSIVGAVFTGAILQVYQTAGKTESISMAQAELQRAFQRVDKELRYASWIAEPGKVATAWYLEFAGFDGTQCGQLRLETSPSGAVGGGGSGVLQLLWWPQDTPPAANAPAQTIASQLVTPEVDGPFQRQSAGTSPFPSQSSGGIGTDFTTEFQRVRIRLTTRVGDSTAKVDSTFTALNTSRNTQNANLCSKGRPL